jgi:hypothetical protein
MRLRARAIAADLKSTSIPSAETAYGPVPSKEPQISVSTEAAALVSLQARKVRMARNFKRKLATSIRISSMAAAVVVCDCGSFISPPAPAGFRVFNRSKSDRPRSDVMLAHAATQLFPSRSKRKENNVEG